MPKIISNEKKSSLSGAQNDIEVTTTIFKNIKPFSFSIDTEQPKIYNRYVKTCESIIRSSNEYRGYIGYLKECQSLTACAFLKNIDIKEIDRVSLEFHHYPFNLYEIVDTVIKKQTDNFSPSRSLSTFDICDEVLRLHYSGKVGLIPLTKTLHELAHAGELFINLNLIYGDFSSFVHEYGMYIDDDLLAGLDKLKELSKNESLKTNNFILKKRFQNIAYEGRDLQPITSANDEIRLA